MPENKDLSLQEFINLDPKTKDYHVFTALKNIPSIKDFEKLFAKKWVETWAVRIIRTAVTVLIVSSLSYVIVAKAAGL